MPDLKEVNQYKHDSGRSEPTICTVPSISLFLSISVLVFGKRIQISRESDHWEGEQNLAELGQMAALMTTWQDLISTSPPTSILPSLLPPFFTSFLPSLLVRNVLKKHIQQITGTQSVEWHTQIGFWLKQNINYCKVFTYWMYHLHLLHFQLCGGQCNDIIILINYSIWRKVCGHLIPTPMKAYWISHSKTTDINMDLHPCNTYSPLQLL